MIVETQRRTGRLQDPGVDRSRERSMAGDRLDHAVPLGSTLCVLEVGVATPTRLWEIPNSIPGWVEDARLRWESSGNGSPRYADVVERATASHSCLYGRKYQHATMKRKMYSAINISA